MDRKSTLGACQILGGKLVCWSANKQQLVVMSSAEAEYVIAAGCCTSILWMKSQLSDYDIHYKTIPIFCDNTIAIAISNNSVLHSRTKHIDIREFWCTAIATHLNSPTDNSKVCPLKEYTIKFLVMNDKRPLILDFKTFIESTGFDYAKDAYVSHPSHEVVKVLGGNYSSIEQVNSIQQLFAYCLLTGTKAKGPEASGSLPQNRKKPKSKKPPTETKVTPPPKPTEDSEQSYLVSLGIVHDPQDLERNIQLAGMGLPFTSPDEGIHKSQPLLERTTIDPKDLGGNV
ncbi:hypothetical protein Tco_1128536 [Tanacetum coccineum]